MGTEHLEALGLDVSWFSDRGPRPSNQDSVRVAPLGDDAAVVVVADGMGGRLGGEVASREAVDAVVDGLESGLELADAVRQANGRVWRRGQNEPRYQGMGTTIVVVHRVGSQYWIANVGDSRLYEVAGRGIAQITDDHSFTEEAVARGEMTREDAENSPWAHALTRALGTESEVEVDLFGPFEADRPHTLVLCTDGLYRAVSDEQIRGLVLGGAGGEELATRLGGLALEQGTSDNVTVAVVSFQGGGAGRTARAGSPESDLARLDGWRTAEGTEGDDDDALGPDVAGGWSEPLASTRPQRKPNLDAWSRPSPRANPHPRKSGARPPRIASEPRAVSGSEALVRTQRPRRWGRTLRRIFGALLFAVATAAVVRLLLQVVG